MANKMVKFSLLAIVTGLFVGCTHTYDLRFSNEDRLDGAWEISMKSELEDTFGTSLFNSNKINSKIDITFTQKDLRKSFEDDPIAEFYIKDISYVRDSENVDFSKYIDKKLIGRWVGKSEYEFTCGDEVLDYSVFHVISDTGALAPHEVNFLTQFNRENVSIGDEWESDKSVVVKSQNAYGLKGKEKDVNITCKLIEVETQTMVMSTSQLITKEI